MIKNLLKSVLQVFVLSGFAVSITTVCAAQQSKNQKNITSQDKQAANTQEMPKMVKNGLPGAMHERLNALVGDWAVQKTTLMAGGTKEKPLTATLNCRRQWIEATGNRFIQDITEGTMNGSPYYRLGILGYSTMDKRYEWNTADALNSNMMTYKGAKNSGAAQKEISMSGEFTDQGLLGDAYIGKNIAQRTVIKIESSDRHVVELYFTPPGESERLVDSAVYTRRK